MKYWLLLVVLPIVVLLTHLTLIKGNEVESTTSTTTVAPKVYRPKSMITSLYYGVMDNIIEKITNKLIKRQQEKLKSDEPITYKYNKTFTIKYSSANGYITVRDPVFENSSNYTIRQMESHKARNSLDFVFYHPKLIVDKIQHKWEGELLGFKAKGNGVMETETTELKFNGTLYYKIYGNLTLRVTNISLDYSFDKFKLKATGINIPFLSAKKIDDTLTENVARYLREKEPELSAKLAENIKDQMNTAMERYTIQASLKNLWTYLTSWMKKKSQDEKVESTTENKQNENDDKRGPKDVKSLENANNLDADDISQKDDKILKNIIEIRRDQNHQHSNKNTRDKNEKTQFEEEKTYDSLLRQLSKMIPNTI